MIDVQQMWNLAKRNLISSGDALAMLDEIESLRKEKEEQGIKLKGAIEEERRRCLEIAGALFEARDIRARKQIEEAVNKERAECLALAESVYSGDFVATLIRKRNNPEISKFVEREIASAQTGYPDHPGWTANDCEVRIVVNSIGDHRSGYACAATGGHCLPGDKCPALVESFKASMSQFVR